MFVASSGSLLQLMGSLVVVYMLSCSLLCGILVPKPGIKPEFPALQGRILTTGPQASPSHFFLC